MNSIDSLVNGAWTADPLWIKIAISLGILGVMGVSRFIAHQVIWRRTEDIHARYRGRKTASHVSAVLALTALGFLWISDWRQIVTYLGLVSAGIAIALKDLIADIAGWGFILARRPFVTGDRIEIGDTAGDVVDIRLFQFTVLEIGNWVGSDQSTGRVIHVPNGSVFTLPLANYTRGFEFIWNEVSVLVTFESDWKQGKKILQRVLESYAATQEAVVQEKIREASKRYLIVYSNLKPIVYTRIEDSGILLTGRYLCLPRKRRDSENGIHEAVLEAFGSDDSVTLAYPTRRIVATPQS